MVFSMYDPKLLEGVRTIHFIGCGGSGTYPLIQKIGRASCRERV